MMFKAYIVRMEKEDRGIKVIINVYDEDEPAEIRQEKQYDTLILYNQPDGYFESCIQKILDDHKSKHNDFLNKQERFGRTIFE